MTGATETTQGPRAPWHPGGLREFTRLELAPELLAVLDPLLEGLTGLAERAGPERPSEGDEMGALARDAAAVAGSLRTVEEHSLRSTLTSHEHELAHAAARGARELEALVAEIGAASGPVERAASGAASLRETYLLRLPDETVRHGLRWIVEEVHTGSLDEGRIAYEPTMVTAYCRAAACELRYLAARLLDVSAETWIDLAHGAGRTCVALAEQLDVALVEPERAPAAVQAGAPCVTWHSTKATRVSGAAVSG